MSTVLTDVIIAKRIQLSFICPFFYYAKYVTISLYIQAILPREWHWKTLLPVESEDKMPLSKEAQKRLELSTRNPSLAAAIISQVMPL